nr:WbqC family protein [uncultured Desulfuromonas sp.]
MNLEDKKVAIIQSSYIPWKGYFNIIDLVDEFILLDHVQMTRRDWRNRNRIMTSDGPKWLTVPIKTKGRFSQKIIEAEISDGNWGKKHWATLLHNYSKAPFFEAYRKDFEDLYLRTDEHLLSRVNYLFMTKICEILGIDTKISLDSECNSGGKVSRLVDLCRKSGATMYLSGPSARGYLDVEAFREAGMKVMWMTYKNYPPYAQRSDYPFCHEVSIVDALFNLGAVGTKKMMLKEQDCFESSSFGAPEGQQVMA